jgi:hypothetical protein
VLTCGLDPDPLIGRVKFLASVVRRLLHAEISYPRAELSQRERMELCELASQRERWRYRPPISPVERNRDLAVVGEAHHDAGAATLVQVSHDRKHATHERVDGVGDDD